MGNGQSSPTNLHPVAATPKPTTTHRERASSPGAAKDTSRRRKSLELPDLASLTFTNTSSPASSTSGTPNTNGTGAGVGGTTTASKANLRGLPPALSSRKRPSPLAPSLHTSPLSPISTRTDRTQPAPAPLSASHNPYFPSSTTPAPVPIPASVPVSGGGLPNYDSMTYRDQQSHLSSSPPDRPQLQQVFQQPSTASAGAAGAENAAHLLPGAEHPYPTSTTSPSEPPPALPSKLLQRAAMAPARALPTVKKARIAPEAVEAKAASTSACASTATGGGGSTTPVYSPPVRTDDPTHQYLRLQQGSLGGSGIEEESYIRSSLPLGGEAPLSVGVPVRPTLLSPSSASSSKHRRAVDDGRCEFAVEAQRGVPTIINWTGGGKEVFVCGTFAKNWKERIKMNKSTHDFSLVLNLPPGPHRLKFIVDESWRCSDDLATATDADGSLVNYLEVEPEAKDGDVKTDWGTEWDTQMGGVEPEHESLWTSEIPAALVSAQALEESHLAHIATLAPANRQPGSAALQNPPGLPNPPSLPRHLEKVILNNPPKDGGQVGVTAGSTSTGEKEGSRPINPGAAACWTATPDDNSILPIPNHVVLNHLTASAIRNGTLAVGTTTRYKRKYISTLLYKPVEI